MNQLLIGALLPVGISALFALWNALLKREKTYKWGIALGQTLSKFLGQKVKGGKTYEKNEARIQTTLYDFTRGIIDGMDKDDEESWQVSK